MAIRFDITKVIEASAVLLKQHPDRQMSRLRLLKLLYMADRECLSQTLWTITGDSIAALDHGPVPCRTHDILRGTDYESPQWDRFIEKVGPSDIRLAQDPGNGELTKRQINILLEVCQRHSHDDDYAVAVETQKFVEYQSNRPDEGGSRPIPLKDLLTALGLHQHLDRIIQDNEEEIAVDQLLASVTKKR